VHKYFFIVCSVFILIIFASKLLWKKELRKENIKEFEKKRKGKTPACAQPNSPSAHSLSPSPAQADLRPAKRAQPGRGAPLLSLWLTGGPHLAVPAFLLPP